MENTKRPTPASAGVTGYVDVIYTWENGREEVRYRRLLGTSSAQRMIDEVAVLQQKYGEKCPYSLRYHT